MESLTANRPLLYSLLVSASAVLALASGLLPDVTAQFQLVEFDSDVSIRCLAAATVGLWFTFVSCSNLTGNFFSGFFYVVVVVLYLDFY